MEPWVIPLLSLLGGAAGAFIGMRTALVRLETQMTDVRTEIAALRKRAHDQQNDLLKLDGRVTMLERRDIR